MPEGDTIFRAARTLHRALSGQTVTRFETVLPHLARVDEDTPLAGRTVETVQAQGKWIHMRFSGGLTLLSHMRMSGSWHIYRPGEPWQRSRYHMRIVIETAGIVAVGFDVPVAEFHTEETLARRRGVKDLGPDLLSEDFDPAAAMARLRAAPEMETGDALLKQSLMAGLGNVFKSEVCFVAGVNPFRRVASLSPQELGTLVATSRELLAANVTEVSSFRQTRRRAEPFQRLWVYGRGGEPCRRCGTQILTRKQGQDARVTFWCPLCQPEPR